MTITEMIENLQAFKERWGDIEVFIPETTIFDDDYTDIYKKVDFCKCGVVASSAIRDKIIAVVYKKGDETFDYRSKG